MTEELRDRSNRERDEEWSGEAPQQDADPSAVAEDSAALEEAVSAEKYGRLAAEKAELTQTLIRRQADFDNYRKRIERERQEESRRATGRMLQELLPVVDAMERALRAHDNPAYEEFRKGVELIYRQLSDTLSKSGLERIAASGKRFDPHVHEAIERVETRDFPDGTIIEVVQEGYQFDGRVLRPSLVRVAVAPEGRGGDVSSSAHHKVQH